MVRAGVKSQLDWNITYPSGITEIIDVVPPNRIVPKKNLTMKVRVLGVAFQSGRTLLPLDAYWSKNNSSWDRFFYGTGPAVVPSQVRISEKIKKNDIISASADDDTVAWYANGGSANFGPPIVITSTADGASSRAAIPGNRSAAK